MIYHSQEYYNDKGATIIQNHIDDGLPPDNFPLFVGVGAIQIPTPMGLIEEKVQVPIPAKDLQEAFSKFEETMKKDGAKEAEKVVEAIKDRIRAMSEQQSKKIVTAGYIPENLPPFRGIEKG